MRNCHSSAFGAFLGGALALLFASCSGAETREIIRDFVDDEMDAVRSKADDAREFVEQKVDKYKRKARRAVGEIQDMVEEAKGCVESSVKKAARVLFANPLVKYFVNLFFSDREE